MKPKPYRHRPRTHRALSWTVDRLHPTAYLFGDPGVNLQWHTATLLLGSGGMAVAGLTIAQGVIEGLSWITAGMGVSALLLILATLLSWWLTRALPVQEDWKEERKKERNGKKKERA